MKSKVFTEFTLTFLPAAGLIIFAGIFICACIWLFRKDSKNFYGKMSNLPFDKE